MAILFRSPVEPAEPVELELVPIDPEDLDATRPDDFDVCTWCIGQGVIPLPGADGYERTCHQCHGTGKRGAA